MTDDPKREKYISLIRNDDGDVFIYQGIGEVGAPALTIFKEEFVTLAIALLQWHSDDDSPDDMSIGGAFGSVTNEYEFSDD